MGRDRRQKRGRPGSGGRHFQAKRRKFGTDIIKTQKAHLKQFGEAHPVDDSESVSSQRFKIVKDDEFERQQKNVTVKPNVDESSDEEPEENNYMDLLDSLGVKAIEAEDSSTDEENDSVDDDEEENADDEDADDNDDGNDDSGDDDDDDDDDGDEEAELTDAEEDRSENNDENQSDDNSVADGSPDGEPEADETGEKVEELDNDEIDEATLTESDPFRQHFDLVLSDSLASCLIERKAVRCQETLTIPYLSRVDISWPKDAGKVDVSFAERDTRKHHVKQTLCNQLAAANLKCARVELTGSDRWTPLQQNVFACLNSYRDLYFPERSYKRGEELRLMYCMHAVNHMLKTRGRIMAHNSKIRSRNDEIPDEFRDKGFTRPKILILLPFRDSALRVVNMMSELLADKQSFVSARKRFVSEYSVREDDERPKYEHEDWETIFAGNTNECFTIGLGIAKKTLKLYTKLDDSDIIIASPLGLWGVTESKNGGEEAGSECDMLSSIEVMIVDQADVLMMQNWDHVLSIFERINRQPVSPTGIDFARVRMWTLNGWSKLYRQTIVFSEFDLLPLQSVLSSCCSNYAGRLLVRPTPPGVWCRVIVRMRHEFCRFNVDEAKRVDDRRFEYFTSHLLSIYSDVALSKTLVFVSSSFDFIRLRNLLMRRRVEFVTLSEYDDSAKMKRARSDFVNEDRVQLMLMTERFVFYRRREFQKVTGIRHLLFYDLPTRPQFYADICNWVRDHRPRHRHNEDGATCRVVYCKYDIQRLRAVLGCQRADAVHLTLTETNKCMLDPPLLES